MARFFLRQATKAPLRVERRKVEKRLWRVLLRDTSKASLRAERRCASSQLREALLNRPKGTLNCPKGTLNRAKRLSTARRALSTARSASQRPEGHSQPPEGHSQLREAPLNLFLNKKYRNFLVVSRSCIIFAEIFDIDRNLNIYHYDRRKTDTGWR